MSLKEQIQTDLIAAMKARDEVKTSTLRMLKSEVGKFEVSGKEKIEATDDDWMRILNKQAKQRKDSIEQFTAGGREDLVGPEQAELEILEAYLPEMMSEDKVKKIVEATVSEMGVTGMSDMGKVMGAVMGKVGSQADGGVVKTIVQSTLNNL